MEPRIADVFAQQLGLITSAQAHQLGLTRDAVLHRVERGDWERVRTGLFRLRGSRHTWEQDTLTATLAAGPLAWASHFTALRLWGYRGFDDAPIEITVPLDRRPRIAGVRVHRSGTVAEADLRMLDAIPLLSAARTLADVSSRFDDAALGALIDDGLRRRVLSLHALHAVARRLPTIAPGRSPERMARLLAVRTAGFHPGDSELESTVHRTLVNAGLPAPVRQHRLTVNGRTYFLDLAYPERKIAIEVDGFEFHRERNAFDHDRARQNDLVGAGWTVVRFTSRSTDAHIIDTVRTVLFGR
ncbi:MAG: type IV toxin-antitoxin system AbiEi family antitoxin domain-containing protein [Acidimicrobiia bacterium]